MEYEVGIRLDQLEMAVIELQKKLFPERFKKQETKAK
jgi:hypothetical protein